MLYELLRDLPVRVDIQLEELDLSRRCIVDDLVERTRGQRRDLREQDQHVCMQKIREYRTI